MLKNFTTKRTSVYLIVQFITEIKVYQITKNYCEIVNSKFENDKDSFMAPHQLVCGVWNSSYYIKR